MTCRPIEDDFPKPQRSRSLPSAVEIAQRWNKFSCVPTATTNERQIGARYSLTGKKMVDLFVRIRKLMEPDTSDVDEQWFSSTYGKELLKKVDVGAGLEEAKKDYPEWKNTASNLTAFVCNDAPQIFTMLVYNEYEKLLDQFYGQGMDDSVFPVKLARAGTGWSIESTQENQPKKLKCNYHFAKNLCYTWQWQFFVPKLDWTTFDDPPIDSKSRLPFLTFDAISRTGFGTVYKGVIHHDHITLKPNGVVST